MAAQAQKVKTETVLSYSSSGVTSLISFALILPYTFVRAELKPETSQGSVGKK